MSYQNDATLALLDSQFFVPLEQRATSGEYRAIVADILEEPAWSFRTQGVWTSAHPLGWVTARQGWKLHVSALPSADMDVLRRVAGVLKHCPAAFKFAADRRILDMMLSKNWPREGGGKFITIYPRDEEHFTALGRSLAEATESLDGPYILSDRRVPGSRIVFYRYGEHLGNDVLNLRGERTPQITTPAGEEFSDQRKGHFHLPEWLDDPYGGHSVRSLKESDAPKVTLNGRYEVRQALKYSNVGGVYRGNDLESSQPVVIRERRPNVGWLTPQVDAVELLRKEARILQMMEATGLTPRYLDMIQVWEHHYLVMEDVSGVPLRQFVSSRYLQTRKLGSPRRMFGTLRSLLLKLLRGMEQFHARGLVLRDLTVGNVLVRRDGSVCFIDFEYAWERDGNHPAAHIQTEGFASPEQVAGALPGEADDYYALGAVLVDLCSFMAGGLGLNPMGILSTAELMMAEMGMPATLLDIARGLLNPDPAARWKAEDVRRALKAIGSYDVASRALARARDGSSHAAAAPVAEPIEAAARACEAVGQFFESAATPTSSSTLWPTSPQQERTNPVSVLFGASGPVEFMRRLRGTCPSTWLDWVEQNAGSDRCPPGLYLGRAGVAMTLGACGRTVSAQRMLLQALSEPLPWRSSGLYYGAAGIGLAALALGRDLSDPGLKEAAVRIADTLLLEAKPTRRGLSWPDEDDRIPCGLAAGASGIALFLTYVGAVTNDERYWAAAERALTYDFSLARARGGDLQFPDAAGKRMRFWTPHVSFGTAGFATAAARLYACTGNEKLRGWLEQSARTLSFRWTNKLWQDMGYAGFGDTLLDVHAVTGEDRYHREAARMAEILIPNQVQTRFGIAFPGLGLYRVTSDFGLGTSGIALFLHRLVNGGQRPFFPDHLLPGWTSPGPWMEQP